MGKQKASLHSGIIGPSADIEIQKLVMERLRFAIQERVSREMIHNIVFTPEVLFDEVSQHLIVQLQADIFGRKEREDKDEQKWSTEAGHVEYPKDWRQAFKHRWSRWIPNWWLRRHPVEFERIAVVVNHRVENTTRIYRICPHMPIPEIPEHQHQLWLESYGPADG